MCVCVCLCMCVYAYIYIERDLSLSLSLYYYIVTGTLSVNSYMGINPLTFLLRHRGMVWSTRVSARCGIHPAAP